VKIQQKFATLLMNNLPVDARHGSVLHGTEMKESLINHTINSVLLSIKV